jgi:hypothetical protein
VNADIPRTLRRRVDFDDNVEITVSSTPQTQPALPPWFNPQIHSGTRTAEAIIAVKSLGPLYWLDDLGQGLWGWRCNRLGCPQYRAAYGTRETATREALAHQKGHG